MTTPTPTTSALSDRLMDARIAIERGDRDSALAAIGDVQPVIEGWDADRLLLIAVANRGKRALDSEWIQRRLKKQSA